MSDLISRQAAINNIKNGFHWETVNGITAQAVLKQVIHDIEIMPSVQPERERGKWDTFFSDSYKVHKIGAECSCCGYRTQERTNYCPNCGADMREDQDE